MTRRTMMGALLALRANAAEGIATAATGETILHPLSKATYRAKEHGVDVPVGMVYIPSGKFTMGTGDSEHQVHLDGFAMSKFLVTNAEYKAFADATGQRMLPRYWRAGAYPEDKANHPVLWVSWNDARKYCDWINQATGRKVSLPTEAQWEKAARGPNAYTFPWGNERDPSKLNYNGVCARKLGVEVAADGHVPKWKEFTATAPYRELVDRGGYTTPVGAYPQGKSHYGCYDMAGNAWQWCLDWYKREYYKLPDAARNPQGPTLEQADEVNRAAEHGKCKVIRGGSWYAHLISARSTFREETRRPEGGYHSVGFRIVAN